ncbi:hypothetical protein EDB85DRAFT_1996144, partial [Lactarius pseudohatsudake]
MAVAVAVVRVAVVAATICGSRVADDVGGSLCGRWRAVACYESWSTWEGRGGGSVMATIVLHQFEMRGKEKERKKEDLS